MSRTPYDGSVQIGNHSLLSKEFWIAVAERAIKTFAQALAGSLLAYLTDLFGIDWVGILYFSGIMTLLSVLTSVASGIVAGNNSPSLANEVIVAKRAKLDEPMESMTDGEI